MISINGQAVSAAELLSRFPENAPEREMIHALANSAENYRYDSMEQLDFELRLRREIINASNALYKSGMNFEIFRDTKCNEDYWDRRDDGGFALKSGVQPAAAIRDIFQNGRKYGTECATAMVMIYYKALLEVFGDEAFNRLFPQIYLMNWHRIDSLLREVGQPRRSKDFLPGDRRYFKNPDVDPETPEWQGENVIDLGGGIYYGHGVGKGRAEYFLKALNGNRRDDADQEAYLMDTAARPNFRRLYGFYQRSAAQSRALEPAG